MDGRSEGMVDDDRWLAAGGWAIRLLKDRAR